MEIHIDFQHYIAKLFENLVSPTSTVTIKFPIGV